MSLEDATLWEHGLVDHDPNAPLEYGREYVAIGPAEGSKLGPPQRITVVGLAERDGHAIGYDVKGTRLPGTVVLFGCERFWRPA